MQLILVVSIRDLRNACQLKLLLKRATSKVKKAPTAAASVGVNIPKKRPPITKAKIIRASKTPTKDFAFSFSVVFGPGGASPGFSRTLI
jgi:hypothetical protein